MNILTNSFVHKPLKHARLAYWVALALACIRIAGVAQVNSGSDGHDGVFNPTTSTNMDMSTHPDGIYQYKSVNIPAGVTVTFTPNANNTPVVWLVQSNCVINGGATINVSGYRGSSQYGGLGGPGGYRGGNGGSGSGSAGQGPGGGMLGGNGFCASFGTLAIPCGGCTTNGFGPTYGNPYLVPLIGGSGGGGTTNGPYGGGGGGGAILIAASKSIVLNGTIQALGGCSASEGLNRLYAGGGSGGAVRLVSTSITGNGLVDTTGGGICTDGTPQGGFGRVRFDFLDNHYIGSINGVFTQGYQPIIIPPANIAVSLVIQSVGGVSVAANPSGSLIAPDVIIPGQQANPIPIVVGCVNIPLNTPIIVDVKPANGPAIEVTAPNNVGTQASSTATASVTMPRAGGTIQAKAVSGITNLFAAVNGPSDRINSFAKTGLTAEGEHFTAVEMAATLGSGMQIAYLTESGKRYFLPER